MATRRTLGSQKVQKSMDEMQAGTLHSGGPNGPAVSNPKQAIAIGLSEARNKGANTPAPQRRKTSKFPGMA